MDAGSLIRSGPTCARCDGCSHGELEAGTIGDLDESRKSWLVRAKIAKTRKARWVQLPADLFDAVVERLPAREDRDMGAPLFTIGSADRLRMAIGRACRDAAAVVAASSSPAPADFAPTSPRRDVGRDRGEDRSAQPQLDCRHVLARALRLPEDRDRSKLLERVRMTHTPMHTSEAANAAFAATS